MSDLLEAHKANQNACERGANEWTNDRNSGISPIRVAFTRNRKNRVGDTWAPLFFSDPVLFVMPTGFSRYPLTNIVGAVLEPDTRFFATRQE